MQRIRLKQGHPTRIANPAVRDHAGNAHAENTVQRVICGRAYRGKLVEFLEPLLMFMFKVSRKDYPSGFIVGLNGCIRLTRSARRIPVLWSDA